MTNSILTQRLLKYTSRGLYLLAAAGLLYVAIPSFKAQSDMPALAKNFYAKESTLVQRYGFIEKDFRDHALLTSVLLHVDAADSVLRSGRSFDYQFGDGWQLSDASAKLFTTPGPGVLGMFFARCEGPSRRLFGMAAQAKSGPTGKQAVGSNSSEAETSQFGPMDFGVNISEQQGQLAVLEATAKPWWHAPQLSVAKVGTDKKAEMLKTFPGIGLDCQLAQKSTSTLKSLVGQLPELFLLTAVQEAKAQVPAHLTLATLGLAKVTVTSSAAGTPAKQLTLVAVGKSAAEVTNLDSAYEKAVSLFAQKAPFQAIHYGHQDGQKTRRVEFAVTDGLLVVSLKSEAGSAELTITYQPENATAESAVKAETAKAS